MEEDKLTIFITTYKDFKYNFTNPVYKVLDARDYRSPNDILDDRFYSEIFMYYKLKVNTEYVGFCHYRKRWEFFDNIPDIDKIFESYDVIAPNPITLRYPVKKHYSLCHNGDDLDIVRNIIYSDFKEYIEDFDVVMNSSTFFPYNAFIMRREDFEKYRSFVKGVLDKYIELVGTDIRQMIIDNKDKYLKTFSPNNTIDYQYRIGGYLAERLTNVFIMRHFRHPMMYSMVITEKKYGNLSI